MNRGKQIVINADDFGLSAQMSKGIIKVHKEGIVTSASFMVTTSAFASSLSLARETLSLDLGIHLVATGNESQPVLPPSRIRSLVPDGKRFPRSWKEFLLRLVTGRIDPKELYSEFEAQILKLLDNHISLSHLDSNQHIHLFPSVSKCVLELTRKFSIPFIRAPKSIRHGIRPWGVNFFSKKLMKKAAVRAVPSYGFDFSGRLDLKGLREILDSIASDDSSLPAEISVHPGFHTDDVSWGYNWEGELNLLIDPESKLEIEKRGAMLTSFKELATNKNEK